MRLVYVIFFDLHNFMLDMSLYEYRFVNMQTHLIIGHVIVRIHICGYTNYLIKSWNNVPDNFRSLNTKKKFYNVRCCIEGDN